MSGDYYAGPNPLLKGTLNSVERERLRERDREARAQMTYEAEQRASQDVVNSGPLFGEIVRVNPKSNDFERQQIERKLGKFDDVKHLLADQDVTNLFGIDGQPPPSPAPASSINKSSSSLSSHEFKKPNMCSQSQQNRSSHHHHHHHSSSSQRGGFVKPTDGKPAYSGRGFYPGQPMKHSSSSSNDLRGSGMVPMKGPPTLNSSTSVGNVGGNATNHHSSSSSRSGSHEFANNSGGSSSSNSTTNSKMHQRTLPKLHCEPRDISLLSSNSLNGSDAASQANVENILDEMTSSVRTPLTAIAATPRKEMESKFTFNSVSGKMESISPIKPPVLDKNSRSNALNSILGPPGSRLSFLPASVFKPDQISAPFLSPCRSPPNTATTSSSSSSSSSISAKTKSTSSSGNAVGAGDTSRSAADTNSSSNSSSGSVNTSSSCNSSSIPALTSSATSLSKSSSIVLPTLKSDLSLSEDSEDEDDNDDNDDSEEESNSSKPTPNQPAAQKPEVVPAVKSESTMKSPMSPEDVHDSSSSDDSESDSGSESEDSSSDSPSPPSLPLPVAPDPEDNKHRWNLKNFLPPSHGNSTPAPQTPQACENDVKIKTDDSDSSGDTTQNTQVASSSSSESDADSDKGRDEKYKSSRATQSDDSTDEDDRNRRRKYRKRRSSSSSQSSDDSDQPKKRINQSVSGTSGSASNASNAGTNNNSNLTVVGVVRPHQRKPPSPQVFNRTQSNADDRFAFVQQQRSSLQMSAAPEPQCELPSHSDSGDTVMNNVGRNRLTESFSSQRAAPSVNSVKSVAKPTPQPAKTTGKGRKVKSPAMISAVETPGKKKRGRKKIATKQPDITDSEDEEPKVKVPERKRPGRPPLKRNDNDDVDWNAGSRRKTLDKFPPTNVWGGRERRRSSLRCSFTTQDSDSEVEPVTAPVKPTARVFPVNKKKEGSARNSRDSSCESSKNDSDFTVMSNSGSKNSVTKAEESPPKLDVEGIAVQDKKKCDTLRKLFSRREEGGGKGGGKGKGGKGKCGVIVMESEAERKMLDRSMSPAPTLHRMHDHMSNIPLVEISPPLQQNHIPELPRINDRVPELSHMQMSGSGGGSSGNSRASISRRGGLDRVPVLDSSNLPTIPSTSSAELPKLTYGENGKPSLMVKIDLGKIPYILAKKRSEEIRIKSELSDTRQPVDMSNAAPLSLDLVSVPLIEPLSDNDSDDDTLVERKRATKKHLKQKTKSNKRKHRVKEEPPPPTFTSAVHTPSVDPESDSMSSDSESRKKMTMQRMSSMRPPADPIHNLMSSCYPMAVGGMQESGLGVEHRSDDESWPTNATSCSSCSESPAPYRKRSSKHHPASRKRRRTRSDHSQRHASLIDTAPPIMHVPGTNHERSLPPEPTLNGYQMNISELVRPVVPTHHGIYYSYLEHKASEELNSESDNVSPNVYLMEAKRLKHAADSEKDVVSQGMQYMEAILSFVLTGHVLERRSQIETAFSMYSETLKLIVYISKKFRTVCTNAAQSNIPNKIAILSLRCESILNLKLYTMREMEVRNVHSAVTEYFNKPIPVEACLVANQGIPSPHSPTPSPASSVGSNSSGYSSGDRRTGGVAQCIAVPMGLHAALQKQHTFYSNLIASFNYWEEADKLIFSGGNKDFFIELDRFCGPLTLHSSLKDLVHYVRVGIQRLKAIISHHHRV